jgi:transcription-repair coupling factor (superfamily II helicase)
LEAENLIEIYTKDGNTQALGDSIAQNNAEKLKLSGLNGSLVSILLSTIQKKEANFNLVVLSDTEEAGYFYSDLLAFLPSSNVFLYPQSYKKMYDYEETENANIQARAEVLSQISNKNKEGITIITYPEAIAEKVISRVTLQQNTLHIKLGEKYTIDFIADFLTDYQFERTDFVSEPGQFAIRGGIVDVYSFAIEYPYRMEFFGNEIESIRIFDPRTQISIEKRREVTIIPNIKTHDMETTKESFLSFIPQNTAVWFSDIETVTEKLKYNFNKAEEKYRTEKAKTKDNSLVYNPGTVFIEASEFLQEINTFTIIEFGKHKHYKSTAEYHFETSTQPEFNQDFNRLCADFADKQIKGFRNLIAVDTPRQMQRLETIISEHNKALKFEFLNLNLHQGYVDHQHKLAIYTDHQIFGRYHAYKEKNKFSKNKALTLKELTSLSPGDYVTHVDYGIGRFAGLEKVEINGRLQETIRIVFRDDDLLKVSIHALNKISRYTGKEGTQPQMSKLGSPDWENKKKRVKKQVQDIAKELIELYAKRKAAPGFQFSPDSFLQVELESSFIYEDTPDQAKASADVKYDMEQPHPMDRLVCGDVGFGKTEVAIRAAFKACCDGKQVAVLVPTTILAMQHFQTFKNRLQKLPVTVEYINRFKSAKQTTEILKKTAEGKVDILIGTHKLISKSVVFKDLGLLVIDEEQKFGVKAKEQLKQFKVNVDTLTLTATPIPRTLHFSLMGARDLSVIATPPPNRQPVTTEVHAFNEVIIRDAVNTEIKRGGQVFMVHNRVHDLPELAGMIQRLVPEARVAFAHGQMEGDKLEEVMLLFIEGTFDVLVSTNIIEAGLDIPNANTIIINQAHMFGLSDLHQMRGRVGRSNKKAFCYLMVPSMATLTSDARKRLSTLEEFNELGDGFKVAMRDLDIRGAGNLLGAEQSGFVADLGFDMYHKILDEAVQELKETQFKDLFATEIKKKRRDCTLETDLELIIPERYVQNTTERYAIYSDIDNLKSEEELQNYQSALTDKFGNMPKQVSDLLNAVRLRWMARDLGFEKLTLKLDVLKGYLATKNNDEFFQSDSFGAMLSYVQLNQKYCRLKDAKEQLIIIVENVNSVDKGLEILKALSGN